MRLDPGVTYVMCVGSTKTQATSEIEVPKRIYKGPNIGHMKPVERAKAWIKWMNSEERYQQDKDNYYQLTRKSLVLRAVYKITKEKIK